MMLFEERLLFRVAGGENKDLFARERMEVSGDETVDELISKELLTADPLLDKTFAAESEYFDEVVVAAAAL
jgi:hypothetical protein